MSELFEDEVPEGGSNAPEFSVSELTGDIKKTLEGAFGRVRVRGEIGRVMHARSGHLYYDLKDDKNVVACNTWKGQVRGLSVTPEEGMEVIVTGRLSTFGPQSKYNLNVDSMEVAGEGALMAMLEKRKKALAAEGLFDLEHKQAIPYLPRVIGVVTSPSGAVIRDILHRLRDRFPRHVLLWPVAVQGQNCAAEVAAGIKGFNALEAGGPIPRPALIIVARGGGSVEDLWGFNEEVVVRAAAASQIPLISAVGHETDTTLIDFASDKRAPTPTAAAEMAVPVRRELWVGLQELGARSERAVLGGLDRRGQRLRDLARALPRPETLLDGPRQRFDDLDRRLGNAMRASLQNRKLVLSKLTGNLQPSVLRSHLARQQDRHADLSRRFARIARTSIEQRRMQLETRTQMLDALSYKATLKRGFAVVRDDQGAVITSAQDIARAYEIEFGDGAAQLTDEGRSSPRPADATQAAAPKTPTKTPAKTPRKKAGRSKAEGRDDPDQGNLF